MKNRFLDRLERNNTKYKFGDKAVTRQLSKYRNGRKTIGSGGKFENDKGDLQLGQFLVEGKSTAKESISVKKEMLDKIFREAMNQGKIPALLISFQSEGGLEKPQGDWYLIPDYVFLGHIV